MRIKVKKGNCTGCRLCMQICAISHYQEINPNKSALKIDAKFPSPGKYQPKVCTQCGKCEEACPDGAISENEIGAYIVDKEKCTLCGDCIEACPVDVVFQHPDLDHVIICDFCMKCTETCNTGAIVESTKKTVKVTSEEV